MTLSALATDPIQQRAVETIFNKIDDLGAGTIAIDAHGRVVLISEKYLPLLGLSDVSEGIGRNIEEVVPNSQLRQVVTSGEAIPLDLMQLGERQLVVTRMPIKDDDGTIVGAVGFVMFDRVNALKPLISKITKLQSDLQAMREKLNSQRRSKYSLNDYVGDSTAIRHVKWLAERAAAQDTTVLLCGETGTGKELIAHAIHDNSARADKPFVAVNVAAIPETLLEAEFFGTAPGAYTGADRRPRAGKFQLTDGGTLFLDEIGDMPLTLQTKLLRALQEHEIEPLGSNQVVRVDVRIVAATNVDLEKAVAEGRFRRDLFYRLNVLPIRLPPLRTCMDDLALLADHLLQRMIRVNGFPRRTLAPSAIDVLRGYDYPGNVRELYNLIERAVILSDTPVLEEANFDGVLPRRARESGAPETYANSFANFERTLLLDTLHKAGGQVDRAAELLEVSRATLYKKLARYGIHSTD